MERKEKDREKGKREKRENLRKGRDREKRERQSKEGIERKRKDREKEGIDRKEKDRKKRKIEKRKGWREKKRIQDREIKIEGQVFITDEEEAISVLAGGSLQKIIHNRSTNSASFFSIQRLSLKTSFPCMQLK